MADVKDVYANKAYGAVTESAITVLTFSEIQTNVSIFEKEAWIVNRLEWYVNIATLALLDGPGDAIQMALTASDNITTLGLDNPSVIDMLQISTKGYGTPANIVNYTMPMVREFGSLPGGGIIIAPRPLYVGIVSASIATVATAELRMSFQKRSLKAEEYLELIDFYRIVS